MLRDVILPTLGLDMEEAVIQKWFKAEGDRVAKDEPLLLVETDKAATEINSPASGVLQRILHGEGATVPVKETIALIETEEATPVKREPVVVGNGGNGARYASEAGTSPASRAPIVPETVGVPASPAARRLARELGVDLALVQGTGPRGRIQGEDVRRFAASRTEIATPTVQAVSTETSGHDLPGRLVPHSRKRKLTAERMALSTRTVARLTLNMEVDATEMVRWRSRVLPVLQQSKGLRVTYNDLLVKVVAAALREHPYLNAQWTDQGIYLVEPVNVGVAVAVEDGLVVPVVRNADRKTLEEVSVELAGLVAKAREDRLALADISGGTFTITNLGMYGIDSFTPIINPPEAAILGVGRIGERAVAINGQMVLRPMMSLSLSFDHRILDGVPAAQFLQRVRQLLEEPYLLL